MSDIIDINISPVVEEVTLTIEPNLTTINVNTITGGGGGVPYVGATENVDLGEFELKAGQIEFDQTPTQDAGVGVMRWNDADGTVDLGLKGGNVTLQIGQEQVLRVVNKTATNISLLESNYQAVRVTGAQGQRLKVDLALATNDLLSAETIGLVTETIPNNQEGFITTSGLIRGINTTGSLQGETWVDGDILYLSPTTAGRVTKVKPIAPNHLVIVGYVVYAHANNGIIFVKVDNGYELDELHNVKITTPLNNQGLVYNSTSQVWENKNIDLDEVLGVGNTAEDKTINLTNSVNTNVSTFSDNVIQFGESDSDDFLALNKFGVYIAEEYGVGDVEETTYKNGEINYTVAGNETKIVVAIPTYEGGIVNIKDTAGATETVAFESDIPAPITIDATPTDGSSNAVSSNGVFDALATNFEKVIIKDNYFWFTPSSIFNSSGLGYSTNSFGQSFLASGGALGSKGMTLFNTTAVAGTIAFKRRNDAWQFQGFIMQLTQKIQFQTNISGQRFFHGLTKNNQFSAPTNVDQTTLTNIVGVCQLSTSTNMHVIHNDASGTATTIDLGSDYPCNDTQYNYFITIEQNASNYVVTVERVTVATGASISTTNTLTTNIMDYTTGTIQICTWITNNATASVASYLDGGGVGKFNN